MTQYRKKPITIEATQWFEMGDHEKVIGGVFPAHEQCKICKQDLLKHGRILTLEGWHIVCPSDWIITGVEDEVYPCKSSIFEATYDEVSTS